MTYLKYIIINFICWIIVKIAYWLIDQYCEKDPSFKLSKYQELIVILILITSIIIGAMSIVAII